MEENQTQNPQHASGLKLILRILLLIAIPMALAFALNYLLTRK